MSESYKNHEHYRIIREEMWANNPFNYTFRLSDMIDLLSIKQKEMGAAMNNNRNRYGHEGKYYDRSKMRRLK